MIDGFGRNIDYIRISVTDRCDLRCVYCMPARGVRSLAHEDILRYEDILRLARIFSKLGIKKVRLTGGEPLARKNLSYLVAGLKDTDGIETVFLTTNGMLLSEQLLELVSAGLDGVNISLDAIDENVFQRITRRSGVDKVLDSIDAALSYPELKVKINCVPTKLNESQLIPMTALLVRDNRLALRFIELMPIGLGKRYHGKSEGEVRSVLESEFAPMTSLAEDSGGGLCRYFALPGFNGKIGFISAISHKFCYSCNRVRLTSDGFLKTCLQYDRGVDLKALLCEDDKTIKIAIEEAILKKPACHHFIDGTLENHEETRKMSQIGG